eukprot:jgi/Ulvmu1/11098/UM070_0013.1
MMVASTPAHTDLQLLDAAREEVDFLRAVNDHADVMYDSELIRLSVCRYERLWMPLVRGNNGSDVPKPPLDIAFIWHCHALCPLRYFADWETTGDSVPAFTYPDTTPQTHARPTTKHLHVDLSSREAAQQSMWASLQAELSLPTGPYTPAALPPSQLSHDLAAAAARQSTFFYQVSLPHYRDTAFLTAAVARYNTFLRIRGSNPGAKLCPTYDMNLVWHAHMAMPLQYKADTEARVGLHLPHDDSINDRTPGAELRALQAATERLLDEAGAQFFQPGGMFRGTPAPLMQPSCCDPEAPKAGVSVEVVRHVWKAPDGQQAPPPDAALVGWSLQKKSVLGALRSAPTPAATDEAVVVRHNSDLKLRVHVSEGAAKDTTATGSDIVKPMLHLPDGGGPVEVAVAVLVKLKRTAPKQWLLVVTLRMRHSHRTVVCSLPRQTGTPQMATGGARDSAVAEVSQPELLLPAAAADGAGTQQAEALEFPVELHGGPPEGPAPCMKVKITNTLKHLATAVEVTAPPSAVSGGSNPQAPAATARSINLAELPRQGSVSAGVPALDVGKAERAFLLRSGDRDWGILIGAWEGASGHQTAAGTRGTTIGTRLHVLDDPEMHSRGGAMDKIFCGDSGMAALSIDQVGGTARLDFAAEPGSAREAGRFGALLAAIATCRALLTAQCMPCGRYVSSPENPRHTLEKLATDTGAAPPLRTLRWCSPVLQCRLLPTNGHIITAVPAACIHDARAVARGALLPWFGTADPEAVTELAPAWWNGPPQYEANMAPSTRTSTSRWEHLRFGPAGLFMGHGGADGGGGGDGGGCGGDGGGCGGG